MTFDSRFFKRLRPYLNLNKILQLSVFDLLRSISGISALFIYPNKAYQSLLAGIPEIHVPLFDFVLFYSPLFIFSIKAIFLISLLLLIFGFKVELIGVVAAVTKFTLLVALPDGIGPFAYLFPFGWIAFSIIEYGRKNGVRSQQLETPLVWFMCSVYLGAAMHRLFHFELLKNSINKSLTMYSRPEIRPFLLNHCPKMNCAAADFLLYSSIPTDIVLCLLFAFRKTRMLGLAAAICFHFLIGTFLSLIPISFLCLSYVSSLFLLRFNIQVKDLICFKWNKHFFIGTVGLIVLLAMLYSQESLEIKVVYYIFFSFLSCLPFIYLGSVFYDLQNRKIPAEVEASSTSEKKWIWSNVLAALLFILFALSPALIDNYRKNFIWGWAVFSGAETKWPPQRIRLRLSRCPNFPRYFPLLLTIPVGPQEYVFISASPEFLNRYIEQLKKACE